MSVFVAIDIVQPTLVIILTLIFLGLLATRGMRKGQTILVIIFLIITVLIALSIYDALRWYSIPLRPPPEIFSEIYSDSLFLRSWAYTKALIESILFLILSISLVFMKLNEEN